MFDLLFEMIYPLYIERCKEIYKKVLQGGMKNGEYF